MNSGSTTFSAISIRRATLQGYLVALLGLLFVIENTLSVLGTGGTVTELSGIVLGVSAIGGGVLGYFSPERFPHGTEPAPTSLYVLTGGATAAFVAMLFLM